MNQNFKQKDIAILLSPNRLKSYKNIDEHFDNLILIGGIAPKLAIIEIVLRNLMDILLKQQEDEEWLLVDNFEDICEFKNKIINRLGKNSTLTHDQFLSNFTLGMNIYLIKKFKLQEKIFLFQKLNFKYFYEENRNFYFSKNGKKIKFKDKDNANIILDLLSNIRNRAFHWENLLKLIQKDQKLIPRLSINMKNTIISIHPQKIDKFLDCILNNLDSRLLEKLNTRFMVREY